MTFNRNTCRELDTLAIYMRKSEYDLKCYQTGCIGAGRTEVT
jgi:hypothetical protein